MYAIVNIAGQQTKVAPNETVRVPRLEAEVGSEVTFDSVMLFSNGDSVEVGTPFVSGKQVTAKVVAHDKDKKIIVFKKKRRKKYRRKQGHRQQFTELEIKNFG